MAARPVEGVLGRFSDHALHLPAGELATETTRKTLVKRLQQNQAYHVDLAVQDNSRAVRRLAATLEKSGIQVVMGPGMQDALKQKTGESYCLFADDLKPDELASLLQQLGLSSNDRKRAGSSQVVVDAMTLEQKQKLAALLGLTNRDAASSRQETRDPLGELVNKKIIPGNSAGQGTASSKPKVSPLPERFALVVPMSRGDLTGLGDSPEVRAFLSKRRGPVPGALQVFLVIHEARS